MPTGTKRMLIHDEDGHVMFRECPLLQAYNEGIKFYNRNKRYEIILITDDY